MKYLMTAMMLFGIAYGQCSPPASLTISELSTSTARITYTAAASATLYSWNVYTTPVPVLANSGTTTATTFIFSGLQPSKTYRFAIVTICGGLGQTSSPDSVVFTTPPAGIVYTPMTAAGYDFKYLKADSGMALPVRDTLVGRGVNRGGLLVWKSASGMYVYNGSYWEKQGNKYFNFDNNFTVTQVADTFFVKLNSILTGPDRLIETGGVVLTNVNRVTVLDVIKYTRKGVTLMGDSAGFTIPLEPDGIFRSYALVIASDGIIDTLRGVADSFALVNPDLRPGDILIGYVDVFGTSVQVTQSSANQRYSVRYIDPVSGLETGDSTAFKWDPAARTLSIGASNSTAQSATFLMNAARVALVASFNGLQVNVGSGTGSSGVMDVSKTILFTNRGTSLANFSAENDSTGYLRLRKGIGLKIDGLVNNSAEDSAITVDFTTKKFKMKKFADGGGAGWGLTGNSGTDPSVNFIGTTDNTALAIRSDNTEVARFQALSGGASFRFNLGMDNTVGAGIDNFALGRSNNVTGNYAGALNESNTASGSASLSINQNNTASGANAFASGSSSNAVGNNSASFNEGTAANGENSFATGNLSESNGISSFASNKSTAANGENSAALNGYTIANGDNSAAMGFFTVANSANSLSIGRYNVGIGTVSDTSVLLEIGNGYSSVSRSNIFTVTHTGVGIGATAPIGLLDVDGGGSHDVVIHNLDEVEIQANDYTQLIGGGNEFDSAAAYVKLREDSVGIWPGWALSSSEIVLHGSTIDMWSQRNHVASGASYFQQTDRGISMASSNDVYANFVLTDNHIAFTSAAIGGANATFERGNMILSNGIYQIGNDGDSSILQVNFPEVRLIDGGSLKVDGNISLTGSTSVLNLKPYTVATLPSGNEGDYARVTDALLPSYGDPVVGDGLVGTPVFFTNGVWTVH